MIATILASVSGLTEATKPKIADGHARVLARLLAGIAARLSLTGAWSGIRWRPRCRPGG
jgi:hypothetical protein